jgi:hypothetical protein
MRCALSASNGIARPVAVQGTGIAQNVVGTP